VHPTDSTEGPLAGRPALAAVSDPELWESVQRLAAAAGAALHHAADLAVLRRQWRAAALVLLDDVAARACAQTGLPRRSAVMVVTRGEGPPELWRHAVAIGAERVLTLPEAESWLVTRLTETTEEHSRQGRVLAVVGGRGGAGASVLAVAVAVEAARGGQRVLLLDCDPLGGGLDLALGAENVDGLRWPDIDLAGGRVPATALHAALPAPTVDGRGRGELGLLSCDRSPTGPAPAAVAAVIDAGRRAGETVVCDLPRYPTESAVAALAEADLTVLVVPADVRSCAAAARVAAVLVEHCEAVRLLVRGPAPGGVAPSEVAAALELPLLTAMRTEPRLPRTVERGELPGRRGPLAAAARTVLTALAAGPDAVGRP
jgi:secretion/DNA translocation related CpaE-like protein